MDWNFISNLILASVRMATPLLFLSLAELYSQRAGLVHIGLEGLASIGSLVGFLVCLITGDPFLGVLAGAAAGIAVNMIYAYATINLCAEQIVYGMAINIFAPALAAFIYRVYFGAGSELVQVTLMSTVAIPGLKDIPFIGPLLFDQTPMVYLAYALGDLHRHLPSARPSPASTIRPSASIPRPPLPWAFRSSASSIWPASSAALWPASAARTSTTCYSTTYVDGNVAGPRLYRPGCRDLRPLERAAAWCWPACSSASATRCRSASRWALRASPTSSSR